MFKIGEKITLKGKKKSTGIILEYDKKRKSYLIDRGYKTSWVYKQNILSFENNKKTNVITINGKHKYYC